MMRECRDGSSKTLRAHAGRSRHWDGVRGGPHPRDCPLRGGDEMNPRGARTTKLALMLVAGLAVGSVAGCKTTSGKAESQTAGQQATTLGAEEAASIATDAYVYGYSLLTTEVTRVQMSNVDQVDGMHAPMGQFANIKRYPPADFRGVSAPNADTLYSVAWLDLSEPQVFSHPDMGKRFYLFEMTDLWMTDFDSPGTRTTGGDAASYLITGPGWSGTVPPGLKQIKCATRYMVILGRTYASGTERDYKAVNALQAQYKIVPLSAYRKSFEYKAPPLNPNPGFSMTDAPQKVINAMDTSTYFNMMTTLMSEAASPAPEDAPILARMATI